MNSVTPASVSVTDYDAASHSIVNNLFLKPVDMYTDTTSDISNAPFKTYVGGPASSLIFTIPSTKTPATQVDLQCSFNGTDIIGNYIALAPEKKKWLTYTYNRDSGGTGSGSIWWQTIPEIQHFSIFIIALTLIPLCFTRRRRVK